MKSKKKIVLAGLVLLVLAMVLLPLAGCKDAAGNGGGVKVYSFPAEVKVLTDYKSPNNTSSEWTYVAFGEWPQSVMPLEFSVEKTESKQVGRFTYYRHNDGSYYVEEEENAYGSGYKYSDTSEVKQKNKNGTRWFKVEPIVWRVLNKDYKTTGTALLLAEKILTGGVPYYVDTNTRTIAGAGTKEEKPDTVYANNYKYSTIRAWLNGSYETNDTQTMEYTDKGFLQTAFTQSARDLIADTTVYNSKVSTNPDGNATLWNSGENQHACANTSDKIFLLSQQEATNSEYGFGAYSEEDSTRIRVTTDYAKATGANQSSNYGGWWWLRSPYCVSGDFAYYIASSARSDNYFYIRHTHGGVVPALSISLQ